MDNLIAVLGLSDKSSTSQSDRMIKGRKSYPKSQCKLYIYEEAGIT